METLYFRAEEISKGLNPFISPNESSMIHFFEGEDDAVMDDEEEGEVEPAAADEVADPATDDSE